MKVIGIFRGFPGLGRVVAGLEILKQLETLPNFEARIFTYLQGTELSQSYNFQTESIKNTRDICSIGIIPVSKSGEAIINCIENYSPHFVLIDGEPLLVTAIKLRFPELTVIALLNPFDLDNPYNQISSQMFFQDCYSKADIAIVHGLWKIEKPKSFSNSFYSINTFVRQEFINLKHDPDSNRIACILGGGSVNSSEHFFEDTIQIANSIIELASYYPSFYFDIYSSCESVFLRVSKLLNNKENIRLHKRIHMPTEIFQSVRAAISRAGRNSISELLSANIPSLLISTNCETRGAEQKSNVSFAQKISPNVVAASLNGDHCNFNSQFKKVLSEDRTPIYWETGNNVLLEILKTKLTCI